MRNAKRSNLGGARAPRLRLALLGAAAFLALVLLVACSGPPANKASNGDSAPPPGSLELVFPYGSEKEKWIAEVTEAFNRSRPKTKSGRTIFVTATPMGSGESIDEVMAGRIKAHILSPASAAFIKLANAQSKARTGADLVASTENLVLSPVVIAMWKPMAELTEMASGMVTQIGGSGDTLDRLTNMVEEERQKAAGRVRVAHDSMDMSGVQIKETEQKALADQALADFAAKEGLPLDIAGTAPAASQPARSMGPAAKEPGAAQ